MSDFSGGLAAFLLAILLIPAGAICAAVLAVVAYRKHAIREYWFVVLASYLGPWLLVLALGREGIDLFSEIVQSPSGVASALVVVPFCGGALLVLSYLYWIRHIREVNRSRRNGQ